MGQMKKMLSVIVLALLVTVVGCSDEPLTLEEYAEACGNLLTEWDNLDFGNLEVDVANVDEASEVFWNAVDDAASGLKELKPPDELQDFHEMITEVIDFSLRVNQEAGMRQYGEAVFELAIEEEELSELEMARRQAEIIVMWEEMARELEKYSEESEEYLAAFEESKAALSPTTLEILETAGCARLWN